MYTIVRVVLCESCVPASCFRIWFVSCPRFMWLSLFGSRCVCVCVIVNYLVYLSPVFCIPFRLVYSSFPVFLLVIPGVSTLPCVTLDVVIKDYDFEVLPRLRVPRLSLLCAPWQKTRPNSKRRPFTSFCYVRFFKCFILFLCFVPRGKRVRTPRALMLAVCGSLRRRSRLSHPAVRGSPIPRFAGLHAAVRGSSRRRSRINQPTVRRRWRRRHPRLTLAHRPAADSMPAGLPLTQCPPACLWLNARRPASDSSPPDCRWLKLAGLPLTHARWSSLAGKANSTPFCSRRRPRLTEPAVRGRSRRRPWGKPTHRRRLPLVRGESQPAVHGSLGPQPTVAPSSPPAPAVVWSSQPAAAVIVKPAGYGLASRPLPYWQASRPWL